MNRLFLFKCTLVGFIVLLLLYTVKATQAHGFTLIDALVENAQGFSWSGQFNLDFTCYLILSGIWIMWRGKFAVPAIVTGLAASVLGMMFFAPYLLYLLYAEQGDVKKLLLGKNVA